jgi:hypothetical protein
MTVSPISFSHNHLADLTSLYSNVFPVSKAYSFNKEGDYNINPSNVFYYQNPSGEPVPLEASTGTPYTTKISGSLARNRLAKRREAVHVEELARRGENLLKRALFPGCSDAQQVAIVASAIKSITYIGESLKFLELLSSGVDEYTRWFGMSRSRYRPYSHKNPS